MYLARPAGDRNPQPSWPRRYVPRDRGVGPMLAGSGEARALSAHARARVEEVRAYLEANMTRDVDMVSVARQVALSPFYLTRIFKAQYGVPPYRYLIRLATEQGQSVIPNS